MLPTTEDGRKLHIAMAEYTTAVRMAEHGPNPMEVIAPEAVKLIAVIGEIIRSQIDLARRER